MIIVEEQHITDNDEREKIITEAINMITQKLKSQISSKKNRQLLLEKYGEDAFLLPDSLKFPIINPNTGKIDCNLLYAALIRIKQYSGIKPGYKELYKKAKNLFNEHHCSNKINIRIYDSKNPTDIELNDLIEFFK